MVAVGKPQRTLRKLYSQQATSLSALGRGKLDLATAFIGDRTATLFRSTRCWTVIGRTPFTSRREPKKNGGNTATAFLAAVAAGNAQHTLNHLYSQKVGVLLCSSHPVVEQRFYFMLSLLPLLLLLPRVVL